MGRLVRRGVGGACGQPPGSFAASPLERGRLPGRGRYGEWLVRRVVEGCGGAVREASCCAGDELPTGMIWLRHELQLGLHEFRCGALGRCGRSADDILIGASPFISAAECIG